ncbi:MAG: hypothetical protein NXH91_16010 [Phyllobacteriaceae bacterium]|nr:hypothetical protein [Phyllobacteriaceae bacterium]
MKLDEYVKQTLLDITNGVADAKQEAMLRIAPGMIDGQPIVEPQMVRFEVAVTISNEAGGGIKVFSLGDLKAQGTSAHTNKIAFEVPVYLTLVTPLHPEYAEVYSNDQRDKETDE